MKIRWCLSFSQEIESAAGLSSRMKGAGGVGGKWQQQGSHSGPPLPPGGRSQRHSIQMRLPPCPAAITQALFESDVDQMCLCVNSCESPSCGRRDVASCCCSGTCNIWFVSSVITNVRRKEKKAQSNQAWFPFAPSCLMCLSSRCPAGCFDSGAAGDCEPAGHHHGNSSAWFICVTAVVICGDDPLPCVSGSADEHAGHGDGRQPGVEPPDLSHHQPSHESSTTSPAKPLRPFQPIRRHTSKPIC